MRKIKVRSLEAHVLARHSYGDIFLTKSTIRDSSKLMVLLSTIFTAYKFLAPFVYLV
ncbi:hypothetical protein [Candidatus Nitrosotenuis uzonensis]|uniref:hypothetical protein n=1 Tax=Candidatus Nitrosotenuis uzonensis TaxID=1407055 RepID=UPI0012DE2472|nr:hypothetical protein [Candidatus Nitrosotenuis uzonensis]